MKRNILAENMRRFGTKNLTEQTDSSYELEDAVAAWDYLKKKNAVAVLNKWKQLEASGRVKKISDILEQGITDVSNLNQDQLEGLSQFTKWEDSISYGAGSKISVNEEYDLDKALYDYWERVPNNPYNEGTLIVAEKDGKYYSATGIFSPDGDDLDYVNDIEEISKDEYESLMKW